jgi:LPS O-antigen subunit length determinant protein (WzzB/FepE family)
MANPMEMFFALGDKVTKGDPKRKMDFDYYLMWIIAVAFAIMVVANAWDFIKFQRFASISWVLIGAAMLWFQYWNLKQFYHMREMMNKPKEVQEKAKELKIESVEDMMKEFQK